jgi:hypothetical protein
MNLKIRTATQFPEKEYINGTFVAVHVVFKQQGEKFRTKCAQLRRLLKKQMFVKP